MELPGLLVGPLEQLLQQAQFMHHFQRRGVDRVTTEVAQKVAMFLEHDDIYPRPREQKSDHHPGRPAADDTAFDLQLFWWGLFVLHGEWSLSASREVRVCGFE